MVFNHKKWNDPFKIEHAYEQIKRSIHVLANNPTLVHYSLKVDNIFSRCMCKNVQHAVYASSETVELLGEKSLATEASNTFVCDPSIKHDTRIEAKQMNPINAFTPRIVNYGKVNQ